MPKQLKQMDSETIDRKLAGCPSLPSLGSINLALKELVHAEQRYTAQISEIIRRDPSLTSRLLRLVNSVYYGLSTPVNSIEEAVFYLGVRQIRQLAMVTPIIEDFQRLAGAKAFPWREFWQHCIGTAIMTREIVDVLHVATDEGDYIAGLVHDVGKIAMAAAFPDHFMEIHRRVTTENQPLIATEIAVLGIDHAELGAKYLKSHKLPETLIKTVRYHHRPEDATSNQTIVAAVQVADMLVRSANIGLSGNMEKVTGEDCFRASGWTILFPGQSETEQAIARASLYRSLEKLPHILEGLV